MIELGATASVTRTFQAKDLAEFSRLAGLGAPDAVLTVPAPLLGGLFS